MTQTAAIPANQKHQVHFDQYTIPGSRIFPEGVVFDPATGKLFTASYGTGAIFHTTLDRQEFSVLSPPGANGCASVLGVRMDRQTSRLFASAGVTGCAFVFDANTGKSLGKFSNGLAPKELGTAGPGATSPTLINDVAVVNSTAYFTDSYHPMLYRITPEAIANANGGDGQLEPWLNFEGTVLKYSKGDGLASGLNLNGIVATPDGKYLLVVQTNSGKLFRITVASKEVIEVAGEGNHGGDGMFAWDDKLIVIDMTQHPPITKFRLSDEFSKYEVIERFQLDNNISPTNTEIIGDRVLITESQLIDVAFGKTPEHPPYRIVSYPLSAIGE